MKNVTATQAKLLAPMGQFVLANGLQNASLRPLAKAAGTSDRMLIYHFGSKDALLAAIMRCIADQMTAGLTATFAGQERMTAADLLRRVWEIAQTPATRPVMRVWLELTSMAARDGGATQDIAMGIADGFLAWTQVHLKDPELASLVLTHFEGLLVMQEAGRADIAEQSVVALSKSLGDS